MGIQKWDLNKVIEKLNEFNFTFVESDFVTYNSRVKFICNKHLEKGIQDKSFSNIMGQKGHGCKYCGLEMRSKTRSSKIEDIRDKFKKRNYTLVTEKYNPKEKLKYICNNHIEKGVLEIDLKKFNCGQGCPYCSHNPPTDINTVRNKFNELNKLNNNEYELISDTYINAKTKLKFKHNKCNNYFEATWDAYSRKNGTRCPYCTSSKGEERIRNILKNLNVAFLEQYKFDDCKDKHKLPFDFYIPNYNCCIEYDGIQHFEEIKFFGTNKNTFDICIYHDAIKNSYCEDNNIRLLRIPYWEFDSIKNILSKFINDPNYTYCINKENTEPSC